MKRLLVVMAVLMAATLVFAQPDTCDFPWDGVDMGDLPRCNYPTLMDNPGHGLSGIAWLGEMVTADPRPHIFNRDLADDGVTFVNLPWMPCTMEQVMVMVTAGPNYDQYVRCGGQLYLSAWKDGNIDGDFCDELCQGTVSEWMIHDMLVTPGMWTIDVMDPGVFDLDIYDGAFRFRLSSQPLGRFGFGMIDTLVCPECICGGPIGFDWLGEVEDYYVPDAQLAVEMSDFDAIGQDGRVSLTWVTISETGNSYFEVIRDGVKIAEVATLGNGASRHTYNYVDENCTNGTTYRYSLVAVDVSGDRREVATAEAIPMNGRGMVTDYALHQNYPNPFNPSTSIHFDLVENGFVSLKVFNLVGQEVADLVASNLSAGAHVVAFDAADLPSGLYVYRLEVNGFVAERKMLLMK